MYPKPLCFTDCLMDLRAASYDVLVASLEVKWMSSLLSDEALLGLAMNAKIEEPTSRSLWYICAESKLKTRQLPNILPISMDESTLGIQSLNLLSIRN